MKRLILKKLLNRKNSPYRKTQILKEFGKRYKDVDQILQHLMLASGQKILSEKIRIIFDEVKGYPKVINSMKCFCENAPQYHIAYAGFLRGIALTKPSFSAR